MDLYAYTYVGPEEIRRSVASFPAGTPIASTRDIEAWLAANPDALAEGSTYVVDLQGWLRLAPRRSEHVACAGGEEVLAAGEIRFQRTGTQITVAEVSNQSTGYVCVFCDADLPARWNVAPRRGIYFEEPG